MCGLYRTVSVNYQIVILFRADWNHRLRDEKEIGVRMGTFQVVEHFVSINGEGRRAGQLAQFIRFAGCNLSCEYCDTKWANEAGVFVIEYSEEELYQLIRKNGVANVTLTGGEPLLQKDMDSLLKRLRQDVELHIEIETNGSVDITRFFAGEETFAESDNVTFTLDYKLSGSRMEQAMFLPNFQNVRAKDTVKFVVAGEKDLLRSKEIIEQYDLIKKGCGIYISPCFGKIEPEEIVRFMIEQNLNHVNMQLQLHKFIWDPDKRGV